MKMKNIAKRFLILLLNIYFHEFLFQDEVFLSLGDSQKLENLESLYSQVKGRFDLKNFRNSKYIP